MNHVFNEMVVKAGRDVDTAELQFINGGVSATFFCAQQAIHAAHAINNHDRMVEENKKLREFVMYCQGFLGCEESRDSIALHGITINAKDLLAKLNQEGEE